MCHVAKSKQYLPIHTSADGHTALFRKKQTLAYEFQNYLNSRDLGRAFMRLQAPSVPFFLPVPPGQGTAVVQGYCWSSGVLGSLQFENSRMSEMEVNLEMLKANPVFLRGRKEVPRGESISGKVTQVTQ